MTKPKNNIIVRELVNKYQANCDRITEIADACEKEQRERNEAENAEFEALTRENQILQMKMQKLLQVLINTKEFKTNILYFLILQNAMWQRML